MATSRTRPRRDAGTTDMDEPELFTNRELSWLDFNERVLELAGDPELPLLERLKFCAIFANNLDEFFMVRVAGPAGPRRERHHPLRRPGRRRDAHRHLAARARDGGRGSSASCTASSSPRWPRAGIRIVALNECTPAERESLSTTFASQIFPVLTPLAVGPGRPFPYISNLSLSLGVVVADPQTGERRFARVKVPEVLPRFLPLGARRRATSRSRTSSRTTSAASSPAWRSWSRADVPRHARRRLRDRRGRRRPAGGRRARAEPAALRRRRARRGRGRDVLRDARHPRSTALEVRARAGLSPGRKPLDLADLSPLA